VDVSHILEGLNDAQRDAVTAAPGNMLVVAGAGSGKTRVLVHRIAWLVEVHGLSPHGILAVTFTNKAAAEMRHRVEALLRLPARTLWVGTFHGIAHRLLRMHWREAGLPEAFQILDADDQLRLVKRVMRSLDLDDTRWPPRQALWFINAQKDEGKRARDVFAGEDPFLARSSASTKLMRCCANRAAWSISPSCCCAAMNSGRRIRRCSRTTSSALANSWSMSFRIPTASNMPGSSARWC
jgi:DNA helicase II / ATP-dependent DNA helicase PcrA